MAKARRGRAGSKPPAASRGGTRTAAILALAAFAVYCANGRSIGAVDTLSNELVPIALLTQGNFDLAAFDREFGGGRGLSGFARVGPPGVLPGYPIAIGVSLTPFYALPVAVRARQQPTTAEWLDFARAAGKVAAAAITALAVAVFYLLAIRLGAGRPLAIALSLAYAFGTSAWSTTSQALWQHGPGTLLMLTALLLVRGQMESASTARSWGLGALLGFAGWVRLANVVFIAPLAAWELWRQLRQPRPHQLAALLLPICAFGAIAIGWNLWLYGTITGLYGGLPFATPILEGLAGVLASPGRGLFVYFPLALLGLAGGARAWRRRLAPLPIWMLMLIVVAWQVLLVARFDTWWGGASYGPRLLSEIQPLLLLLAIPLFVEGAALRRVAAGALLLLGAWCVFLQGVGAIFYTGSWNAAPKFVDTAPERLWDWRDNPVGRELATWQRRFYQPVPIVEMNAEYLVPGAITAAAGEQITVPVTVRNRSRERWLHFGLADSRYQVNLAYHLQPLGDAPRVDEGTRTALPGVIGGGDTVTIPMRVEVPAVPGEYLVEVSLVQELVDWFDRRGVAPGVIRLSVVAPAPAP